MNLILLSILAFFIQGKVIDGTTNQPLPFATVKIQEYGYILADSNGLFQTPSLKGERTLVFSYTGFENHKIHLSIKRDTFLIVPLKPTEFLLEEVVITPGQYAITSSSVSPGKGILSQEDIIKTPGSAADLFWALQDIPGVQGFGDAAVIAVQGGNPDEIGVWVNGLLMPHPYHYEGTGGGQFSFIEETLVDRVSLYQAGFPVDWGNYLSGALDIETKDVPQNKSLTGSFDLSMAGLHLLFERAPLSVSINRSYIDLLAKLFDLQTDFTAYPRSWDIQGILQSPFLNDSLVFFILTGGDDFSVDLRESFEFQGEFKNKSLKGLAGINYTKNNRTSSLRIGLGGSYYKTDTDLGEPYFWNIEEIGTQFRIDFYKKVTPELMIGGGVENLLFRDNLRMVFPEDSLRWRDPNAPRDTVKKSRWKNITGGYIKIRSALGKKWALEGGVRSQRLFQTGEITIEPRLGFSFTPIQGTSFRAGMGIYHQFPEMRQLDPEYGNPELKSSTAYHTAFSIEKTLGKNMMMELEVFSKKYTKLPVISETRNYLGIGDGLSYGFQGLLRKFTSGPFNGWLAYTYTRSNREILEAEGRVPSDFDIRHIVTLVENTILPKGFEIGIKTRWATGRPYTPVDSVIPIQDAYIPVWGKTNSETLPEYLRIDIRIIRETELLGFPFMTYLEILNLTDHQNIITYTYNLDYSQKKPLVYFGRLFVGGFVLNF